MSLHTALLRSFAVLALLCSTLPAAPAALAADEAVWNVNCPLSHNGADDPIVFPNQPGKSHMHSFYANTSTNAATTSASLLSSPSSCGRGLSETDHSAYWVPSIYRQSGGTMVLDTGAKNQQAVTVYYRRAGGPSGPQVQPFPVGLRMIAGNHEATSPQPASVTTFDCGNGTQRGSSIPTCSGNEFLHAQVHFPNCWDGRHLDSADHQSHMAYAGKRGACPADHPVSLPAVTFSLSYHDIKGGPQYVLSSGGQYSMHGDFFAAWDSRVQNALVTTCLNGAHKCTEIHRDGDTLDHAADGTTINLANFHASPQVLADQTQAAPAASPAPAPATPLPQTGASALAGSAVGLAVAGYLFYEYRVRRRSLRQALMRSGRPR